jgi:hypothetical protein
VIAYKFWWKVKVPKSLLEAKEPVVEEAETYEPNLL